MNTFGKILAIDYGKKKIGLAVSDSARLMAFGRGILANKNDRDVLIALEKLIVEENVKLVLIGLPLNADGEKTQQTALIEGFSDRLKDYLMTRGLQVAFDFIDESFTSFEAGVFLREIGASIDQKKSSEDELAAIFLIHRYIDFKP